MIFCLYGGNSYQALRKLREFKAAFSKKAGSFLIEELDGEDEVSPEQFHSALEQSNLFSKTRLVIFKNILGESEFFFEILKENGDFLKNSKDVFVFWEKEPEKPIFAFFEKYAEKIQEVKSLNNAELHAWLTRRARNLKLELSKEERAIMIDEADEGAEWALENELEKIALGYDETKAKKIAATGTSPFGFVEKLVSAPFDRALLALKEAELSGQDMQRLIYPLLWKIKQKRMADAYFKGILAESALRRDPKNSYEILERLIFSLRA